jgi:hypothetical protein
MKTRIFIALGLIIVLLSACELTSVSNFKPEILFLQNPTTTKGDTLKLLYTDQASVYKMDTIQAGDTVNFRMFLNAYTNKISSFFISQSADSVTKILLPSVNSMDSAFLSSSNYNQGKFYMKIDANTLYFPIKYIAIKPSNEAKLILTVISDANFEYNQTSIQLNTIIVAQKKK